jgi:hypothetical protein
MEVLPTPTYIIKALTYKEYNTLCACVAKCAGVKVRVDPTEANELNLKLVASQHAYLTQQLATTTARLENAKANMPPLAEEQTGAEA